MKNINFLSNFILLLPLILGLNTAISCQHTVESDEFTIEYTKDSYKNFHVDSKNLPDNANFKNQIEIFKKNFPGTALYIDQSPNNGVDVDHISDLGFKFAEYDYSKKRILWILDNGRGVTDIGSSVSGAGIIVRNNANEILLILNPDINTWVLPSGGTDRGELIRAGAIRELYEEVKLQAIHEDLKLMAISNSTSAMGRKGLNSINFFYLLEKFSGEAVTTKEAPEIVWVHPNELKGKKNLNGHKLHPFTPLFIDILNDTEYTFLKTIKKGAVELMLTR
ncbi:MAG: NUDIX hydrolase [Oligoflexales bacterium]